MQKRTLSILRRMVGTGHYPGQYVIADRLGSALSKITTPAIGRIGEFDVELDLSDEIQRQIFFGIYDRPLTGFLKTVLGPGSVFYDVGANVGYFSLLAAGLVGDGGSVHTFEPIPTNAAAIRKNSDRNSVRNIHINEAAVSDSSGKLTLFISEAAKSSGWASIVPSPRRTKQIDVPTLTLDDYVSAGGNAWPDLVKLDIEGAEPVALAGMRTLLSADSGPDIVVEVNPYLLARENLTHEAITIPLATAGYRLFLLTDDGLLPYQPSQSESNLIDLFATKKPNLPGER